MQFFLSLPKQFAVFWFFEAPVKLISYFVSLNTSFLQFVSLRLLVTTFFRPWKNEYRKGLVGFSRAFGMFVKSVLIVFDVVAFAGLCIIELAVFVIFLVLPIATLLLLVISL